MKKRLVFFALLAGVLIYVSSKSISEESMTDKSAKILFLHHSTGKNIARGGASRLWHKLSGMGDLDNWLSNYNGTSGTSYDLSKRIFPSSDGYGWNNYPYDYYNIWVQHAGHQPYKNEPTLEMLAPEYDVIMFKHCFPVSEIKYDDGKADAASSKRTLGNYKLQYAALKEKLHQFPNTKFIIWTGAALTEAATDQQTARRMKEFVDWVKIDWNEKGDNIFLWDFYALETEGNLYLKKEYAASPQDPHPNRSFSSKVAGMLGQRIVDVIEERGDRTSQTGNNELALAH
ncbi:MAG: hypothetical protein GY927_21205 [bacterium]|nr:hypothetical protein [bacterium]